MFELWSWNQNLRRELFLSLPSEATQRKALVGTSLQLSFPYCQLPSCWENRIPLTGSRGPSQRWCQRLLSSFSLLVSLLLVSHARRWIPTLFYLLSISSWLPFVFTELTNLRVNHLYPRVNRRVTPGSASRKKHLEGIFFEIWWTAMLIQWSEFHEPGGLVNHE